MIICVVWLCVALSDISCANSIMKMVQNEFPLPDKRDTEQSRARRRIFYANSEPQPNARYSCAASVAIARENARSVFSLVAFRAILNNRGDVTSLSRRAGSEWKRMRIYPLNKK